VEAAEILILVVWGLGILLVPRLADSDRTTPQVAVARAAEAPGTADATRTINLDGNTRAIDVRWDHLGGEWRRQQIDFADLACIAYYPEMAAGEPSDPTHARVELVTVVGRAIPVPGSEPPHTPDRAREIADSLATATGRPVATIAPGQSVARVCELDRPVTRP